MILSDFVRRLRPDHLLGQISLLILGSIVAYQLVIVVILHAMESEGRRHYVSEADFITGLLLALDSVPVTERNALINKVHFAAPYAVISIRGDRPEALDTREPIFEAEIRRINAHLTSPEKAFATAPLHNAHDTLALPLEKGGYAIISVAQHRKPSRLLWRWLWEPEPHYPFYMTRWARAGFLFFISATIILIFLSNYIIAPLDELARRAESFPTQNGLKTSLIQRGPREIRDLHRAIRGMKERILAMVAERTHVLAAVSHDLKTIITRMSLRTEFIADENLRHKMQKDIQLMDAMLRKNLEYLRTQDKRSDHSVIDVSSVIQTVVDEFNELGHKVSYDCDKILMMRGSLSEMHRVFTNLVENAINHGGAVEIAVERLDGGRLQIDVVDDGPGISDGLKAVMFEPFVRGQAGRTVGDKGGFGLGLSIVRSLVESQGGTVELLDRKGGGLIVRVVVPEENEHARTALEAQPVTKVN
ncbi:sensor histidine kinase [Methylocystis parvus]|uniref:histidine kinase n=1 Tax=Methylocystis parvus TaxID=134 RepID=A0A6B8M3Z8_9HYPH|nr:HAMP domain-containing sensor histidine kinase [Methylocystis parvus]QGM96143.1 HAMP domain-containing histidine kinase [Methylocystis parvus]WBK00036.1 HAMP domain-containing histidine kinase [Methylocystis parvus OBBP]